MEVCIAITAITNVTTSDSLTLPSCVLVGHESFIVQHQIDHCGFCLQSLHLACLRNMTWSVGGRFVFIILFSWVRGSNGVPLAWGYAFMVVKYLSEGLGLGCKDAGSRDYWKCESFRDRITSCHA